MEDQRSRRKDQAILSPLFRTERQCEVVVVLAGLKVAAPGLNSKVRVEQASRAMEREVVVRHQSIGSCRMMEGRDRNSRLDLWVGG